MFLVFNKEKIKSYFILLSTVVILFGIAFSMSNKETIQTSVNSIDSNINCINEIQYNE